MPFLVTFDIPWTQKVDLTGYEKESAEICGDAGRWEKILALLLKATVWSSHSLISPASH